MTPQKDRAHPSTGVPLETEVEPGLAARRGIAGREGDSIEESPEPEPSADPRGAGSEHADAAANQERLAIGQLLGGRFRIERELGEGGMGVVYLATDQQIAGETFAIKVMKADFDPVALTVLRPEVQRTRRLSHPNIVDVHSVSRDGARLYVLMEYLEGKPLSALLDEEYGRGMPWSRAWPIIEDVGRALAHAHNHSVVHSDLKPANIFVTTAGISKLLDFGIARASRGPIAQSRSGPFALTPLYASCEMLEGKEADRRDDIYSLACVIYEMLCGERPFGNLTAFEAREARARVRPVDVLSRAQNAALARALAFDREARTASVENLLAGLGVHKRQRSLAVAGVMAAVVLAGVAYALLARRAITEHAVTTQVLAPAAGESAATTVTVFAPPPHSIAVLPFVNMSGDPNQEYFSDGLTEEMLNSLVAINELQVAARTSSFYFKGKDIDIGTIARKLNVSAVLEGSVRRSANTVRISVQLINTITGFQLWSKTFDRDLGDVLKLQTEIATPVATALKVTLLGDVAAKVELGGTRNSAAFDAYLRGAKAQGSVRDASDLPAAIAEYSEAIRLDPHYALAFAARSVALSTAAEDADTAAARLDGLDKAQMDARQALALAPDLAQAHLALAFISETNLDFRQASDAYERALALAPGNTAVLRNSGQFAALMGHFDAGLAAVRRAVVLDPLNRASYVLLSKVLYWDRRYEGAVASWAEVLSLSPDYKQTYGFRGLAYYGLGDLQSARDACETKPDYWASQWCLSVIYDKLGRRADAKAVLSKLNAALGDDSSYQDATIYAQWGNRAKALEWLDTALRLRDPGLEYLKTDPLLDPLRKEPRFQAIERMLKFPD